MAVDNNLDHWRKYNRKNCLECHADCCTMPVEVSGTDLIRLDLTTEDALAFSMKDVAKQLEKDGWIQAYLPKKQIFVLTQRPNGDCIFLDKNRRCTVYENRPRVCREFPKIGPRPGFCPYIKQKPQ